MPEETIIEESENAKQINKIGDFLHEAFCVEGDTKFHKYVPPLQGHEIHGMLFQIADKKRGEFFIAIYK